MLHVVMVLPRSKNILNCTYIFLQDSFPCNYFSSTILYSIFLHMLVLLLKGLSCALKRLLWLQLLHTHSPPALMPYFFFKLHQQSLRCCLHTLFFYVFAFTWCFYTNFYHAASICFRSTAFFFFFTGLQMFYA